MNTELTALCVFAALVLPLNAAAQNDWGKCGKVKVSQLYNESLNAALDEFPWFGRVLFSDDEREYTFKCLSILVSKRHLVSPAHCYFYRLSGDIKVSLGDSGNSERNYTVADIALHPNYRSGLTNDIAVIQLKDNVEFSEFIQPICLPPESLYTDDLLGQFVTFGGYSSEDYFKRNYRRKTKSVAHIMPPSHCSEILSHKVPAGYLCAASNSELFSLSGSVLMGVNIEDSEVKSYYLVALTTAGMLVGTTNVELHMKIAWHVNWINSNINIKRGQESPNVEISMRNS